MSSTQLRNRLLGVGYVAVGLAWSQYRYGVHIDRTCDEDRDDVRYKEAASMISFAECVAWPVFMVFHTPRLIYDAIHPHTSKQDVNRK